MGNLSETRDAISYFYSIGFPIDSVIEELCQQYKGEFRSPNYDLKKKAYKITSSLISKIIEFSQRRPDINIDREEARIYVPKIVSKVYMYISIVSWGGQYKHFLDYLAREQKEDLARQQRQEQDLARFRDDANRP